MQKNNAANHISINIQGLYRSDKQILGNISLDLEKGKWACLLGPSGTGKTTLLRCIAGLENIKDYTPPLLSYMAQQDLLLPWLTAIENISLGYSLRDESIDPNQTMKILAKIGLEETANYYPSQLSTGMRQRISLARTIIEDHPLILMDEPFSALDLATRLNLQNYAISALKEKTVLFVTHDISEAIRLAHTIYIMRGTPATLTRIENLSEDPPPRSLKNHSLWQQYESISQLFFA